MARNLRSVTLLLGAACLSVLLFFSPTNNWIWDPSYYYAQLRSPIIDRSFDLRGFTQPPDERRTALGMLPTVWPIGSGVLWSPFFVAADLAIRWGMVAAPADGLSWPYIALVSAGSALYGLLGALVIYRTCRLDTEHGPALIAALLALLATPLFFYTYRQPIMAHSMSTLANALLLYVAIAIDRKLLAFRTSGLLLGACVGLSALLRWLGVLSALVPGVLFSWYMAEALRLRDWRQARQVGLQALIAGAVALLVLSPQLAFWHGVYGEWLRVPVRGVVRSWLPEHGLDLFVHTNRGLLYWAPIMPIGMLGLLGLRSPRLRAACLIYLAAHCYVLGNWRDWHSGGGYGARYFVEMVPLVALGVALLLQRLWHRRAFRLAAGALAALLVLHQLMLVTIVEQGWLPLQRYFAGAPLGLAYQLAGAQRLLLHPLDLLLPRPFVAADRQSALVSWLSGGRALQLYRLPLVALALIPLALALAAAGARRRLLVPVALALLALALGWLGRLLTL